MRSCSCFAHDGFLTRRGYALALELAALDMRETSCYVDSMVSMSALPEAEAAARPAGQEFSEGDPPCCFASKVN